MKVICLQKLVIRSFRSFSDVIITFPTTSGLKHLSGNNKMEPRLGANGAGKSSLWDALCWCITGSSVRGSRTSSVIAWGKEDVEVVASFLVDNVIKTLRRYGPPTKIELDGKVALQDDIDKLLGLSRQRFLHSVIFGQGVALFPDLSIPERGELLNDVLTLNVWQKASENATLSYSKLELDLARKKSDVTFVTGKLASLQTDAQVQAELLHWETEQQQTLHACEVESERWEISKAEQLESFKEQVQSWNQQQVTLIEELKQKREVWKEQIIQQAEIHVGEIESLEAEAAPLRFELENEVVNPFSLQQAIVREQLQRTEACRDKANATAAEAKHELKSCIVAEGFWDKDTCPTCSQKITDNKKKHELECVVKLKEQSIVKQETAQKEAEEASVKIREYHREIVELNGIASREDEKRKSLQKELDRIQAQVKTAEKAAQDCIKRHDNDPFSIQIEHAESLTTNPYTKQQAELLLKKNPFLTQLAILQSKQNPFTGKLVKLQLERQILLDQQVAQDLEYKRIESELIATEYWKHGFKRIRLYFVQQVLAALQLEIQSAISSLGLDGWEITLSTETETKSATIKLGVQIHVKSPISEGTWDVWSGGETQRLRLAITMGLASLIQRAAGIFFHCEVWDEPTKALSPQGVEDLLEALRYRAESLEKQIWVSDHSSLQFSGFSDIWTVVKDSSGSKVEAH